MRSIAGWPAEGSTQRLVLTRGAVEAKETECAAILAILERLALDGALVTIDAIATSSTIAAAVTARGGDDVLALKQNQPSLHGEVARYFDDPATPRVETIEVTDKDHGRVETRRCSVSQDVAWLSGDRRLARRADFRGASVDGANFTDADLTSARIDAAKELAFGGAKNLVRAFKE